MQHFLSIWLYNIMRKFIVLLVIVAAGYYLYTHQELWKKYNPFAGKTASDNTGLKQTVVWKVISRQGYGNYCIDIILIDGNRWRTESKKQGSSKIYVVVCDGSRTVASPPASSLTTLDPHPDDPRPMVNRIIAAAAMTSDEAQSKSTDVTELRDGHTCWKS